MLAPRPSGELDRDPIALLLAAFAVGLALLYLVLALGGARARTRAVVLGLAAGLLVIAPTAAFVAMGAATDRPYGQDGGVVQLPLAIDRILSGESPYGADYSGTILGKEARVSSFWEPYGGNPILHHHAYLPGTHLLSLPFHLGGRALFGFSDPRFVTLAAWLGAVALAARLVSGPERKLAAAALVAVNPLVYWPQIFGANDVVFVALLLGAVALARAERPVLAGAVLGLACATKQLAWPFAPFLLAHLAGARSWRELRSRPALRVLLRPALAAAAVFAMVVLPVAALDFRAFYGDIVAYNVGLPGGDNYPLGGTPGFGFANFLIYFGRVASLRDYVPFGFFYLLLVPLGLLLLGRQLRDGRAVTVLFTGSVALLASIYFSRVAHPNYLIAAATLLPLAALAGSVSAEAILAPLLLLAVGVEIAENAVFRTTWEQAAAASLPTRLGGLASVLAPRAGPGLTTDPLGLLFSATAAGLAIVSLVGAAFGARPRWRLLLVAIAAVLIVAVPAVVLVTVGDRTGIRRGQDPWIVQVPADAARLAGAESPYRKPLPTSPRGREAWATSFRLEPPRELLPERPLVPAGAAALAVPARAIGGRDPRLLSMAGLVLMLVLVARVVPDDRRGLAIASTALVPAVVFGVVFGSPALLPLAALVALAFIDAARRPLLAGIVAGVAAALDHRALLVSPFLLFGGGSLEASRGRRLAVAAGLAYALLALPPVAMDPAGFLDTWRDAFRLEPGIGLGNLFLYLGLDEARGLWSTAALTVVGIAGVGLWKARGAEPLALAAAAALAILFVSAGASSAEALAIPLVLLGLASAVGRQEDSRQPMVDS
jgi:Glycosyltransferase family 87